MNETNISWRMIPTFDFTPEMFSVQGIEVMGTPSDTDAYIRNFVSQNCIKISRNVEKLEPFTVGFSHFQLVQKCRTHVLSTDMSVNITLPPQGQFLSVQDHHVDTVIANVILKWWFWFDTERHHSNISQGRYVNSILGIGRFFITGGTKTLAT
jgi:hypothetical protein